MNGKSFLRWQPLGFHCFGSWDEAEHSIFLAHAAREVGLIIIW